MTALDEQAQCVLLAALSDYNTGANKNRSPTDVLVTHIAVALRAVQKQERIISARLRDLLREGCAHHGDDTGEFCIGGMLESGRPCPTCNWMVRVSAVLQEDKP